MAKTANWRKIQLAIMGESDATFTFNETRVTRYGSRWVVLYSVKATVLEFRVAIVDDQFDVVNDVIISGGE